MNASPSFGLQISARRIAAFALLTVCAALITLLFLSSVPPAISLNDGLTTVSFAAVRTELLPQDCVRFDWNVDRAQAIYFNGQGVAAPASRDVCSLKDLTSTLKVIDQDGSTHLYTLPVRMLLGNDGAFALVTLGLLLLTFAFALFITTPRDLLFITGLIYITSIPMVLLRDNPLFKSELVQGIIWIVWLAVAVFWLRHKRRQSSRPARKVNFYQAITICGLLLVLTVLGYYIPMKQHFYIGSGDEAYNLMIAGRPLWSTSRDNFSSRPFENLQASFADLLTPNSVDGFLWIALFERLLMAISIFALVRLFFPRSRGIAPLIAAILFIVWPAEILRYTAVEAQNYFFSPCLLMLAVVFYLRSYIRGERWLLALACGLLGMSLLMIEAAYLLAIAIPVLLLLLGRRPHVLQWGFAWITTVGLLGFRLARFLVVSPGYQAASLPTGHQAANSLPLNLWNLGIAPLFSFLQYPGAVLSFALYGLLTTLVAVALLWLLRKQSGLQPLSHKPYLLALPVVAVALLLSILPYIAINHYTGEWAVQPLYRSQYFATPIQAILWAIAIELIVLRLPKRFRWPTLIGVPAVIVLFAISSDLQFQANRGDINRQISFEGLGQAFHDLQRQLPTLPPDAVILFTMNDNVDTPFGYQGHLFTMSCLLFNHPAFQGKFTTDGFLARNDDHPPDVGYVPTAWTFTQAAVFNVTSDWQITPATMPTLTPSKKSQPGPEHCTNQWCGLRWVAKVTEAGHS